jgi:hypothetical protein
MLPHDQRRARRAHRRRRAPTATVERRQHEQSPRRASEAVQDQARRHGEVEGSSRCFPSLLTYAWRRDKGVMLIIMSFTEKEQDPGRAAINAGMIPRSL